MEGGTVASVAALRHRLGGAPAGAVVEVRLLNAPTSSSRVERICLSPP
jgi:hypothetical protein